MKEIAGGRVAWGRWVLAAQILVVLAVPITLRAWGHPWWCACGSWWPGSADIWSPHNSQHLIDPYSVSHVLHGIIFYWAFAAIVPRSPVVARSFGALAIESLWEVVENTDFVIGRYREATTSLDYYGDSALNSLADIAFCGFGFYLASRLGFWRSVAVSVVAELVMLFWIRDNLTLNVLMLIWPIDAIKAWQVGS